MFVLTIDSNLNEVAQVSETIKQFCLDKQLSEDICFQIEVCIVEAINNAIIHAYDNKKGRIVEIHYTYEDSKFIFDIIDYGKSMTTEIPINTIPAATDTHGRGWYIMQNRMDEVSYHKMENYNKVRLIRRHPIADTKN